MRKLSLLLFAFFLAAPIFAQAPLPVSDKTQYNQQNWFTYFGQYKLSQNWGIHTDVQFRMDEKVKFARQNLLRAGLIRYLKPNMNITAGYAYINTYNANLDAYATENRIWEQFLVSHKLSKLNMTHRVRLEQRFVEKIKFDREGLIISDGYNYGNRIRYFNRSIFDLTKNPEKQNVFYLALQDEVFANIAAPAINSNFFDQNRFLVALGVFHDRKTRLELGYMNQYLNPYNQPNVMNHIVHISVLQTLDFGNSAN